EVGGNTYQYTVTGGKATIVKAEAKGEVVIPETLGGYPVVALGKEAFYYLWDITSVTVPGCVKNIGDNCFGDCNNMESAVLEEGVETIGQKPFYTFVSIPYTADCGDCIDFTEYYSKLKTVTLPDSIRHIGESAFSATLLSGELLLPASLEYLGEGAFGSTDIETLRIPAGMAYTKDMVFSRFAKLKDIVVDAGNTAYRVDNGLLLAKGAGVALYFIGNHQTNVTVPDTTKVIDKFCFTGTKIRHVTLPASLREIRENAFSNCDNLPSIVIPEGTVTVGNRCFSDCNVLADVQLPATLKTIGENAFAKCAALENVVFPCEKLTIGTAAFSECYKLNEVSFTGKDVSIGDKAFYKCRNLKELVLSPEKVHLGASLFAETGISTVEIRSNNITTDPDLYLERELYSPGYQDNNIQKLVIGKNVTTLNEALYLPVYIWSVELEAGNTAFLLEDNVLYNRDKTELIRFFSNNEKLDYRETFTVPGTVKKIGKKAFLGAIVRQVILPSALEIIGDQAFYNSHVLGSEEVYHFILPASVKQIGYRAFGETAIRHFNIMGDKLEALDSDMFYNNDALYDVYYTGNKAGLDKILSVAKGSALSKSRFHYNTTSAAHPFTETVGKKASAKEKGYYQYTCPCGQSYTYPIWKVGSIEMGYHPGSKEFYHSLHATEPHVASEKLEWGVDYTYTVSSKKDGHLTFDITFIGDLYEGRATTEEAIYVDPVKSLAVSKRTADSVTLTWKGVDLAAGYKISRYNAEEDRWETVGSTTALSYTDSDLDKNATYQYRVAGYLDVNGICEMVGDNWVTVSATTSEDSSGDDSGQENTETTGQPESEPTGEGENEQESKQTSASTTQSPSETTDPGSPNYTVIVIGTVILLLILSAVAVVFVKKKMKKSEEDGSPAA
ncbi:MAG: fibronectin type III domain-containing protein, partial [Clostridia bacterium]|nr:fibronectin type III domain-containing protein [Clostridia bacterium]